MPESVYPNVIGAFMNFWAFMDYIYIYVHIYICIVCQILARTFQIFQGYVEKYTFELLGDSRKNEAIEIFNDFWNFLGVLEKNKF